MKLQQAIKELRELRDEAPCTDDHCVCERYDRVIDLMDGMEKQFSAFLSMVADPKHSDGEGLAQIPQEVPDEYLSDGEMLDMIVELLEGLSVEE